MTNIAEYRDDLERVGSIPPALAAKAGRGTVNSAGRIAPLDFDDEALRRLQGAAHRGESCRIETRDFNTASDLLPPALYPTPIGAVHANRIIDRLPGYATDLPSIRFIRHIATTGVPAPTAEGAVKPEIVLDVDELTADVVKLAAHLGLSGRSSRISCRSATTPASNSPGRSWTSRTTRC